MPDLTARRLPARGVAALAALAAGGVALVAALGFGTQSVTAAQSQYAPVSTAPPAITGSANQGATLTASPGTWTGDQPIVFSFQWLRCNPAGQNCVSIPNATGQTYVLTAADVDNTMRVRVTARNSQGSANGTSSQTGRIAAPAGPEGAKKLANGETSIPVTSVAAPERLVVDQVQFNPNPVRSRTQPLTVRVKVADTRGYVVRDALVFIRSTPVVTSTPAEQRTGEDGWVTFTVQPQADFPIRDGYSVQYFVRARKTGDDPLAGISSRRLVQVATDR